MAQFYNTPEKAGIDFRIGATDRAPLSDGLPRAEQAVAKEGRKKRRQKEDLFYAADGGVPLRRWEPFTGESCIRKLREGADSGTLDPTSGDRWWLYDLRENLVRGDLPSNISSALFPEFFYYFCHFLLFTTYHIQTRPKVFFSLA